MYKIKHALKKGKPILIVLIILWVVLSIVLIAPLSISWVDAIELGQGSFIDQLLSTDLGNIFGNLGKAFSGGYIANTLKLELFLKIIFTSSTFL